MINLRISKYPAGLLVNNPALGGAPNIALFTPESTQ